MSRSASITSWLTERSLKKAMCEASLWIPLISFVRHSLRWGWLLNVPKSVVMVFGKRSVCARLDAPELWWGACRLPTADTVKYLRLCLELEGGWVHTQVQTQQPCGALTFFLSPSVLQW